MMKWEIEREKEGKKPLLTYKPGEWRSLSEDFKIEIAECYHPQWFPNTLPGLLAFRSSRATQYKRGDNLGAVLDGEHGTRCLTCQD